jgi:hypothetical protein
MKHNQNGAFTTAGIIATFLGVILSLVVGFAAWAFIGRMDYANNFDKKLSDELVSQKASTKAALQADFDKLAQQPYKQYTSRQEYGSVGFQVPKNWSIFYNEPQTGDIVVDAYFHPDAVPGLGLGPSYATRMYLISQPYELVLSTFDSQVKSGAVSVSSFVPKLVPSAVPGVKLEGQITKDHSGTMVILKVRDKTIEVWSESAQNKVDFENIILETLSFNP